MTDVRDRSGNVVSKRVEHFVPVSVTLEPTGKVGCTKTNFHQAVLQIPQVIKASKLNLVRVVNSPATQKAPKVAKADTRSKVRRKKTRS